MARNWLKVWNFGQENTPWDEPMRQFVFAYLLAAPSMAKKNPMDRETNSRALGRAMDEIIRTSPSNSRIAQSFRLMLSAPPLLFASILHGIQRSSGCVLVFRLARPILFFSPWCISLFVVSSGRTISGDALRRFDFFSGYGKPVVSCLVSARVIPRLYCEISCRYHYGRFPPC